jgi:adenine-specific DNA-methyltransferase
VTYVYAMQTSNDKKNKKALGQYFTVAEELQWFVFDKVKYKSSCLLEPSFGAGHLLRLFKDYDENYPMVCYELDSTIEPVVSFNKSQSITYGDFTKQIITKKFKTIIGNPPYVKQKTGNLYIRFIELCYGYLEDDGELIFIVPSDFIKLTSASRIIDIMTKNGSFTDFLFPQNENLFDDAGVDVLAFRYERGPVKRKATVNNREVFCNVNRGIVTFSDAEIIGPSIESMFHVYVGLVTGRDEVFRVPFGNVDVLTDKERVEKYILPETYPTGDEQIDTYLQTRKEELLGRKIKKFNEDNWFKWGALRNISRMRSLWGTSCIYVRNITRKKEVAFLGTVQFFGGSLLCLVPRVPITDEMLRETTRYINSQTFQKDYLYAGRFKIGQRQISSALIPS